MVKNELRQFIQYNDTYKTVCTDLLESLHFSESTVAAFTRCGTTMGTAFLTGNFTRVFGYPRTAFIKGDLQFLIKHIHPDDLQAFIFFAESSTLHAATWNEVKENAVHEHCCRFKHGSGKWIWIKQKVIVLSVTPERHIDAVLLLFDDCTAAKQAELNQHVLLVKKSRMNSKLLRLLAPVSSAEIKKEKLMPALKEHAALTRREKEIMQLVSQGSSSKEIATKLFISRHTVETHRKHILHKLSVKNSPQMVHKTLISSVE